MPSELARRPEGARPERIVVVFDHRVPAPNAAWRRRRTSPAASSCKKFGIKRFHDVGCDQGISHQLVADLRLCAAGHGARVQRFAHLQRRRVQLPRARRRRAGRRSMRRSRARPGSAAARPCATSSTASCRTAVTTKDAFLQIAGEHGEHATMNVEYGGPGIASLSHQRAQDPHHDVGRALGRIRDVRAGRCAARLGARAQSARRSSRSIPDADARYLARARRSTSTRSSRWSRFPTAWSRTRSPVGGRAPARRSTRRSSARARTARSTISSSRRRWSKGRRVAPGVRFIVTPARRTSTAKRSKSGASCRRSPMRAR